MQRHAPRRQAVVLCTEFSSHDASDLTCSDICPRSSAPRRYSGNRKATQEDRGRPTSRPTRKRDLEKETWSARYKYTAGGRWRQQHKTELDGDKWSVACSLPMFHLERQGMNQVESVLPLVNCTPKWSSALLLGMAPAYLEELCRPVSDIDGRRHLRSARRGLLDVPRVELSTYGRRAFSYASPSAWNALPDYLKNSTLSLSVFRNQLKHFLFSSY